MYFTHCVCSERADPHLTYNKGQLKEGANINKSLVTLGNVIQALGKNLALYFVQVYTVLTCEHSACCMCSKFDTTQTEVNYFRHF